MGKDEIDLIDYFIVIWKRKILIIVGVLACMIVAFALSLRMTAIYRAEALISIGMVAPHSSLPPRLIDKPGNLAESISEFGLSSKDSVEYRLKAEVVRITSLVKVTLEGPSRRRVEKLLEEIVNSFIEDHSRRSATAIQLCIDFLGSLNAEIVSIQEKNEKIENEIELIQQDRNDLRDKKEMVQQYINVMRKDKEIIQEGIGQWNGEMKEMNNEEVNTLIVTMLQNKATSIQRGIMSVERNIMGYRATVMDIQIDIKDVGNKIMSINNERLMVGLDRIRVIRQEIFNYKMMVDYLQENKTRVVGGIRVGKDPIKPNKKVNVLLAGGASLMMFFILAYFMEYVKKVKKVKKDDSV